MEFLFKPQEDLNKSQLFQGDLLARTPALREALEAAHAYYAEAPDYSHFLVLTQSCDLVRRGSRPPKSRYVTLAACRPVSVVLDRAKTNQGQKIPGFPRTVLSDEKRAKSSQLLERLLHNTEDGYFFIRRESVRGVQADLCAFLPLSVALRAEAHYEVCAASKIGELEDIFAAKLGWMTGNLYSRVGTPDLEEKLEDPDAYKRAFLDEFLAGGGPWLTNLQVRWLDDAVRKWTKANKGQTMSDAEADAMMSSVPTSEAILADAIIYTLRHSNLLDADKVERAKNVLASDSLLKRVAKQ